MTAPPSDAIEYIDDGLAHPLYRPGRYNFGPKSASPSQLSCATFTMYILVHWITGMSVINAINNRFSLMNDISGSFGMLCSVKEIYEHIDWECLPVDSTIQGSKTWKTKLFRELGEGFYWVQVDLRDSL